MDTGDQSALQMLCAPSGALYVWPSQDHAEGRALALFVARPDLDVVKLSWLRNPLNWRGRKQPIVVDNRAHKFLDEREAENFRELQALGLLAENNLI